MIVMMIVMIIIHTNHTHNDADDEDGGGHCDDDHTHRHIQTQTHFFVFHAGHIVQFLVGRNEAPLESGGVEGWPDPRPNDDEW